MIKLNKLSRLLASYIDLAILVNLIFIVNLITAQIGDGEMKTAFSILFYFIILLLYLCKDMLFSSASIGKYLLGLKIESTSNNPQADTSKLCVRNLFSLVGILVYLAYSYYKSFMAPGVLLVFLLFNFIFYCFKPNQKFGDCIAKLQVVEDAENKIWKDTEVGKKNTYVMIVSILLLLPFLEFFNSFWPRISSSGFSHDSFWTAIALVVPLGLHIFVFYCFCRLIVKLVDSVLLKKLMLCCATSIFLFYLSLNVFNFLLIHY